MNVRAWVCSQGSQLVGIQRGSIETAYTNAGIHTHIGKKKKKDRPANKQNGGHYVRAYVCIQREVEQVTRRRKKTDICVSFCFSFARSV